MNSNYVNYNRRMLLSTISKEQHQKWVKERDERALKRAKADTAPTKGRTFSSFYALRRYMEGWR
jgi:hypothetical protein